MARCFCCIKYCLEQCCGQMFPGFMRGAFNDASRAGKLETTLVRVTVGGSGLSYVRVDPFERL